MDPVTASSVNLAIDLTRWILGQLISPKSKKPAAAAAASKQEADTLEEDLSFIATEFEMMKSFMVDADGGGGGRRDNSEVLRTWVSQVRAVAHEIEDWLQECVLLVETPSRCPSNVRPRRVIAQHIKRLKSRVVEVSQARDRYFLDTKDIVGDRASKPGSHRSQQQFFSRPSLAVRTEASRRVQLVGRDTEKSQIIQLISSSENRKLQVISIWGIGGVGKTTLARSIYNNKELILGKFQTCAWVTLLHPFKLEEFFKKLVKYLHEVYRFGIGNPKGNLATFGLGDLIEESTTFLKGKRYLIVLDGITSIAQWKSILHYLPLEENASRIIIITRESTIAKHCSTMSTNICKLEGLDDNAAFDLFMTKVSNDADNLKEQPDMIEQAQQIIKKCAGHPHAIASIGDHLATESKTAIEWKRFHERMRTELTNNSFLSITSAILTESYACLPYYPKVCFLHLSIFPEEHSIRRKRMIWRWVAEGYSTDNHGLTSQELAEKHFVELANKGIIQASNTSSFASNCKRIDIFQVHRLLHQITISKSMEESIFVLDEHSITGNRSAVLHLSVTSSWNRDKDVFESMLDPSRLRSLTVFGEWRSYFISSSKMRLLRILDLEDTSGLSDEDVQQIGKLYHLKYLSLRGCSSICNLPDSLGDLWDLLVLDVRGTSVKKLPATIIKLHKLQYLRAGNARDNHVINQDAAEPQTFSSVMRDIFTGKLLNIALNQDSCGVDVPRGISKLKALQTMGVIMVANEKAILNDISMLIHLRKLGVTGINKENCQQFCSAIKNLNLLKSLSVRAEEQQGLEGCLDYLLTPPAKLESLKLYGSLVKLPTWITELKYLQKLKLWRTRLQYDEAIIKLGNLPYLEVLNLWMDSFAGEELCFHLLPGKFTRLLVLALAELQNVRSVKFHEGATPKLQLIKIVRCDQPKIVDHSGLQFLPCLVEVFLDGDYTDEQKEDFRKKLAGNPNQPVLKLA